MREVAVAASRRGPHGWGVVWTADARNEHRELGPLSGSAWPFRRLAGARGVVGHARLATSGAAASLRDTQPMARPSVAIAHNGNVYHHRGVAAGLGLATDCDSELIAAVLEAAGWNDAGLRQAVGVIGSTPYALLAIGPDGQVAVSHRKQPMYAATRPEGVYFGQAPFPGAEPVSEGDIRVYTEGSMSTVTRPPSHPISDVRWLDPNALHANNYNPNRVFKPELELLKISILEDGWTQPVVVNPDTMEVIDGFHRWTLSRTDPDIQRVSNGLVPVVFTKPSDRSSQQMATIRHNRARGSHGIVRMGEIVRELKEAGVGDAEIRRRLGMEQEEIDRLADFRVARAAGCGVRIREDTHQHDVVSVGEDAARGGPRRGRRDRTGSPHPEGARRAGEGRGRVEAGADGARRRHRARQAREVRMTINFRDIPEGIDDGETVWANRTPTGGNVAIRLNDRGGLGAMVLLASKPDWFVVPDEPGVRALGIQPGKRRIARRVVRPCPASAAGSAPHNAYLDIAEGDDGCGCFECPTCKRFYVVQLVAEETAPAGRRSDERAADEREPVPAPHAAPAASGGPETGHADADLRTRHWRDSEE